MTYVAVSFRTLYLHALEVLHLYKPRIGKRQFDLEVDTHDQ